MIKIYLLLAFVGLAASRHLPRQPVVTHSPPTNGRLGIFGGTNATIEDSPYLVSIVYENAPYCTGVIVGDSWVLTIPACVAYMEPSELTIVAESSDGLTGVSYSSRNFHTHPKYSEVSTLYGDYEFSLIEIKGNFSWSTKTQAALLPSSQPAAQTIMQVAGWGETSYGGSSGALMSGNMTWLSKKTCKTVYEDIVTVTPRNGCVYNKGKVTLCDGDWGVPVVNNGVVYGQFFIGIHNNFCTGSAYASMVNDVYPVVKWIAKYTGAKFDNE